MVCRSSAWSAASACSTSAAAGGSFAIHAALATACTSPASRCPSRRPSRRGARAGGRGRRPRRLPRHGLPRPAGEPSTRSPDRDGRARRRRADRRVRPAARAAAAAGRPAAQPRDRPAAPRATREAGAFSERFVFPDAAPLHLSRVLFALERAGSRPSTSRSCATTTPRRCATGRGGSTSTSTRPRGSPAPSASACGASTCGRPATASRPASPRSTRSARRDRSGARSRAPRERASRASTAWHGRPPTARAARRPVRPCSSVRPPSRSRRCRRARRRAGAVRPRRDHLALACASHGGGEGHIQGVTEMLPAGERSEGDLGCGPPSRATRRRLRCASGRAAFADHPQLLRQARVRARALPRGGWPIDGYLEPTIRSSARCAGVAEAAGVEPHDWPAAPTAAACGRSRCRSPAARRRLRPAGLRRRSARRATGSPTAMRVHPD